MFRRFHAREDFRGKGTMSARQRSQSHSWGLRAGKIQERPRCSQTVLSGLLPKTAITVILREILFVHVLKRSRPGLENQGRLRGF